jgi:hypothetical protein
VEVLNLIQQAYNDLYAERAGISNAKWREISADLENEENEALYKKGRGETTDGKVEIPMNISIAEPTKVGG